jgi:hypothetical protein
MATAEERHLAAIAKHRGKVSGLVAA